MTVFCLCRTTIVTMFVENYCDCVCVGELL